MAEHKGPLSLTKILIVCCASLILAWNLFSLGKEVLAVYQLKALTGYHFPGYKFTGLDVALKNIPYVGYITDKNMDIAENAQQFSQAQYMVAPTILDLNNTEHDILIFDCASDQYALDLMRQVGAKPVKISPHGIILARKL